MLIDSLLGKHTESLPINHIPDMKNLLISTVFLLILVVACQKDATVGPPDLLYQRWHLTRTRELTSSNWKSWDTDAYYTTEYSADGSLIYQRNSVVIQGNCCAPTKFSRQGLLINYTDWNICPTAFCATVKQTVISQLTESLLELNDGYVISQYEPAN